MSTASAGQKAEVGTQWCQATALVKFLYFIVCGAGFEPRTLFILGQPSSAELYPQTLYYLGLRPWEVLFSVSPDDLDIWVFLQTLLDATSPQLLKGF